MHTVTQAPSRQQEDTDLFSWLTPEVARLLAVAGYTTVPADLSWVPGLGRALKRARRLCPA